MIPFALTVSDGVSGFFLLLGGLFLLKFAKRFGNKKLRLNLVVSIFLIMSYGVIHEGLEIIYALQSVNIDYLFILSTIIIATSYFVSTLFLMIRMERIAGDDE